MNTLFWLKHQEHLQSCIKDSQEKVHHLQSIDLLRKKIQDEFCDLTEKYYFFIINSFFSKCEYHDIDVTLIPKKEILLHDFDRLNDFFISILQLNTELNSNKKIFDIQVWDLDVNTFLSEYKPNEPIIFGKHVFKKYSGEVMNSKPGTERIKSNLYCRYSEIFCDKHSRRQQNGITYSNPVCLFELDDFDSISLISYNHKIDLFNRIIKSKNFPKNVDAFLRIHNGFNNDMNLLKTKYKAGCPSCVTKKIRLKYLKIFESVLTAFNK